MHISEGAAAIDRDADVERFVDSHRIIFVDAMQWKTKKGGTVLEKTERLNSMNERVSGVGDVRLLSTRLNHRLGVPFLQPQIVGKGVYSGDHRAA